MAINVQKLLPSAKSSSTLAISNGSPLVIKKKRADITKIATLSKERNDENVAIVRKSLVDVDSLLRSVLNEDTQTERTKRLRKENETREERETRLEAPKEQKKFNLPKISLPGSSFLDRIKRFLFFTALGWLFTRFNQELPRLVGIIKVITSVYGVVETVFKFILSSVVSFIERGYDTYDKFRAIVKSIGGENAQEEFDKLSSKLNEYINYVLIGGMALTGAINTFAKNAKNYKPPKPPSPTPPPKPTGPSPAQRVAQKNAFQRAQQASRIAAKKATQKVVGKQATRQLLRLAKGPLSRLPILGGLVEFGLSWALGDPVGKAAFRGVGTLLLGAVGSLIMPGFGTFAGGWLGAELAGKLYEVLFENKKPSAKVQQKSKGGKIKRYAKGGIVGTEGRTLTVRESLKPRIPPQTLQPGKDVGGKKEIKRLFPDPNKPLTISEWLAADGTGTYPQYLEDFKKRQQRDGKKPSPYQALTEVRDTLKEIPYGIGSAMSAAIDAAFGQNISDGTINSIVNGLERVYSSTYLASKNIESQTTSSVSGIAGQLSGMQSGGVVPLRTGGIKKTEDVDLEKLFKKDLRTKITSAIRDVQKQLTLSKKKVAATPPKPNLPGSPGPGPGGGGGGVQPPPTGKNGRYKKSELTYVGKMNPAEPKVKFDNDWYGRDIYLRPDAAAAFKAAQKEAGSKIGWIINSGYRSLEHQQAVLDDGYPGEAVGYSKHGDGIAIDIQTGTNGHNWLVKNGAKFGWIWPAIKGDLVHFYYNGSYVPKGQPKPIPDIFKQDPKQQPGQLPDIFNRPGQGGTPPAKPKPQATGKVYKGTASWYGRKDGFHGKRTSSGEIFNTDKLTAAIQENLRGEFGGVSYEGQLYYAKVTNLDNDKSVIVKINDVGPLTSGGIIDLSEASFKKIASGGLGQGRLYNVTVQKLGPAPREVSKQASISDEKNNIASGLNPFINSKLFEVGPYSNVDGNLTIKPSILMGIESAIKNVAQNYQTENILSGTKSSDTAQYISKQSTMKDVSSLTSYPDYYGEGGMILAIQPIIIEKKIPTTIAGNKSTTFISAGTGVNNNDIKNNLSLSRG